MNALLGIAKIAKRYNRPKIVLWCRTKRVQQLNKEWAKEKAVAVTATDPLELTWD